EAMEQVLKYDTIQLYNGMALSAEKTEKGFEVHTSKASFTARKLLFTSGVIDETPTIQGFAECWGISVLHCPYCHGYEVKNESLGIIANGDIAYEFCRLINNWNKDIILFTNGKSKLTSVQSNKLLDKKIQINGSPITEFLHQNGQIQKVLLEDGSEHKVKAIYARLAIKQHCEIPIQLGCVLTEQGYLQVDEFQKTSVNGVFAAGDNTTPARAVSIAVAAGTKAGISISKELIEEDFE
ncbi:MAG: NAD(P)/FAD-dependent oxidoreductase, partial [Sphingobacteriaceae bacterium]